MNEVTPVRWAWVVDFEGLYRISDRGDVWSEPRATTRGGILKQVLHRSGYQYVTLTKNGRQRRFQVHRLILLAFAGECPEGYEARHLDGNPLNNRWEPGDEEETVARGGNLIWGTHSQNIRDKHRHGTSWQLNVTHCPKGHEYTLENTRIYKSGSRACRECAREQSREWARAHATRKDTTMICPNCERPFERPLGQGARKFCSDECCRAQRNAARRRQE